MRPDGRRRGFTLIELIVTLILLGVAMATVVPVLRWVSLERREAAHRQAALQEAANTLERMSARPWDSLTEQSAADLPLSDSLRRLLRDPKLETEIEPQSSPTARRISVTLRWKDAAGNDVSPVRLTGWVYPAASESPAPVLDELDANSSAPAQR